jgi:hypothetical protein
MGGSARNRHATIGACILRSDALLEKSLCFAQFCGANVVVCTACRNDFVFAMQGRALKVRATSNPITNSRNRFRLVDVHFLAFGWMA